MARVIWLEPAASVFRELDFDLRAEILEKTRLLRVFPRMYKAIEKGRWRRHRRFLAGDWFIYYRVVNSTVYIRGLWPARMRELPRR